MYPRIEGEFKPLEIAQATYEARRSLREAVKLPLNLPVKRNEFCQRTSKIVTLRNGTPIERGMERIPSFPNQ